jgi:hypothetical protein
MYSQKQHFNEIFNSRSTNKSHINYKKINFMRLFRLKIILIFLIDQRNRRDRNVLNRVLYTLL